MRILPTAALLAAGLLAGAAIPSVSDAVRDAMIAAGMPRSAFACAPPVPAPGTADRDHGHAEAEREEGLVRMSAD